MTNLVQIVLRTLSLIFVQDGQTFRGLREWRARHGRINRGPQKQKANPPEVFEKDPLEALAISTATVDLEALPDSGSGSALQGCQ